ncbi:FxsA family protein [Aquihabitans daechungensis]|uniref:FxsA family protein n=1 Tax=Aquihabitans daechungensis TaxID=1052257 RepID=UPI003BA2F63B
MLWLFVLFIVAPLLELYVIIQVASVIGGWETIALLVVESAIGAYLLKRQGYATLGKISQAVNEGRIPSNELIDGLLLLVAGALMLAPGFLGDVLGFLLIIPVTRIPFRALLRKRFENGKYSTFFAATTAGPGGARFVGTFRAGGGAGGFFDTTGSATKTDPPNGELHS